MTISRRDLLAAALGAAASLALPREAEANARRYQAQANQLRELAKKVGPVTRYSTCNNRLASEWSRKEERRQDLLRRGKKAPPYAPPPPGAFPVLVSKKKDIEVHYCELPGKDLTALYVPRGTSITAVWDIGSNGMVNRAALYQARAPLHVKSRERMDLHSNGYCGLGEQAEDVAEMESLMEGMGRRVGRGSAFKNKWFYEANGNLANLITGEFKQLNPAETRKVMQQVYGECLDQALKAFR